MMIIDPYKFGVPCDSDSLSFISNAGITNSTQKTAICKLVSALKTNNLWTKFIAIYPIIGGSASSHLVNLKTPGTYNMTFVGGWNHSSTGILANGVNSYANTNVPMNALSQNNAHLSIYCRTNTTTTTIDMGVQYTTISFSSFIACKISGNFNSRLHTSGFTDGLTANTDSKGQYVSYRGNGVKITTRKNDNVANAFNQTSTSAGANTLPYFIGNLNFNGSALGGYYSNREYAFATLGSNLSTAETGVLYTIIQDFQTQLGRQV